MVAFLGSEANAEPLAVAIIVVSRCTGFDFQERGACHIQPQHTIGAACNAIKPGLDSHERPASLQACSDPRSFLIRRRGLSLAVVSSPENAIWKTNLGLRVVSWLVGE